MVTTNTQSKLGAVNQMLATIGEQEVVSLSGTLTADVAQAISTLDNVTHEVQQESWTFNTEYDYPLTRDGSNNIAVPAKAFHIDVDRCKYPLLDIIIKGELLYDRYGKTDEFTVDPKVTIRFLYDFEEIPDTARRYITIRAARRFGDQQLGDQALHTYTSQDEARARAVLEKDNIDQADANMLVDNYNTSRIAFRRI